MIRSPNDRPTSSARRTAPPPHRFLIMLALAALGACEGAPPEAGGDGDASSAGRAELPTGLWVDATDELLPETGEWTNKVELADLDGDGAIDLLFANGGDYSTPGEPELNRAFLNRIGERDPRHHRVGRPGTGR